MLMRMVKIIQVMRRHWLLCRDPTKSNAAQMTPKKASKTVYLMRGPTQTSLLSHSSPNNSTYWVNLITLSVVAITVMANSITPMSNTAVLSGMPSTDVKQGFSLHIMVEPILHTQGQIKPGPCPFKIVQNSYCRITTALIHR